jgi:ATP-dependent DNA helicase RecQ
LTETERETLALSRSGLPPEGIAERRGLKAATIYGHLARCIEEGELTLRDVVRMAEDEITRIEQAFSQLPEDAPFALKPVFDALDGGYDYGLLRCVRASLEREGAEDTHCSTENQ